MRLWRPYSPKETWFPRCATPRMTTRWDCRNFTPLGIVAMSDGLRPIRLGLGQRARVHPALDPDRPVGRLRGRGAVVDVGLERRQRDRPADLLLDAGDLGAAQAPRDLELDALGAALHRLLDRALHRAPERRALHELLGDALGHERRVELGLGDLEDVETHLAPEHRLEAGLELLGLDALAADQDAGLGRVDDDAERVGLALDLDLGDPRPHELLLDEVPDAAVLLQEARELLLGGVPARRPFEVDPRAVADGVGLLSHALLLLPGVRRRG